MADCLHGRVCMPSRAERYSEALNHRGAERASEPLSSMPSSSRRMGPVPPRCLRCVRVVLTGEATHKRPAERPTYHRTIAYRRTIVREGSEWGQQLTSSRVPRVDYSRSSSSHGGRCRFRPRIATPSPAQVVSIGAPRLGRPGVAECAGPWKVSTGVSTYSVAPWARQAPLDGAAAPSTSSLGALVAGVADYGAGLTLRWSCYATPIGPVHRRQTFLPHRPPRGAQRPATPAQADPSSAAGRPASPRRPGAPLDAGYRRADCPSTRGTPASAGGVCATRHAAAPGMRVDAGCAGGLSRAGRGRAGVLLPLAPSACRSTASGTPKPPASLAPPITDPRSRAR